MAQISLRRDLHLLLLARNNVGDRAYNVSFDPSCRQSHGTKGREEASSSASDTTDDTSNSRSKDSEGDDLYLELAPASDAKGGAKLTTEQLFVVVLAILASLAFLTATIVYARWAMITKFSSQRNNKVITDALGTNDAALPWDGVALDPGVALEGGALTFANQGAANSMAGGVICGAAMDVSGQVIHPGFCPQHLVDESDAAKHPSPDDLYQNDQLQQRRRQQQPPQQQHQQQQHELFYSESTLPVQPSTQQGPLPTPRENPTLPPIYSIHRSKKREFEEG